MGSKKNPKLYFVFFVSPFVLQNIITFSMLDVLVETSVQLLKGAPRHRPERVCLSEDICTTALVSVYLWNGSDEMRQKSKACATLWSNTSGPEVSASEVFTPLCTVGIVETH